MGSSIFEGNKMKKVVIKSLEQDLHDLGVKKLSEEAELVGTPLEDIADNLRNAIYDFQKAVWDGKGASGLKTSKPAIYKKVDAMMKQLKSIDDDLADLL